MLGSCERGGQGPAFWWVEGGWNGFRCGIGLILWGSGLPAEEEGRGEWHQEWARLSPYTTLPWPSSLEGMVLAMEAALLAPAPQLKADLVVMKPDVSPLLPVAYSMFALAPTREGESGMVTLLCPFRIPWGAQGSPGCRARQLREPLQWAGWPALGPGDGHQMRAVSLPSFFPRPRKGVEDV